MFMSIFAGLVLTGIVTVALIGAALLLWIAIRIVRLFREIHVAPGAVIVVTGGSRGLGLAVASRFAAGSGKGQPVRLVLCSRKLAELEQAKATLLARHRHLTASDILLVAADLAVPAECQRLIAETIARFGRIDVLVNNAAVIEVGPVESQTLEIFERTMQINFFAALYTTWAALPQMRAQQPLAGRRRAAIVNIASVGGKIAVPHMLPYSAAKFALVGFSEGLHAELRGKGIIVTTVCPGLMRTGGEDHAQFVGDTEAEKRWFMFAAKTPGVATTAEHAANVIYRAVHNSRAEITITPQAWLAARFGGLAPETLQWANAITNEYILPKAPEVD
jgi:short-subunit dehydrogenase